MSSVLRRGQRALVTGASSGIGEAYAEALAERGLDLLLVARREDRLHALAVRLGEAHGVDAQVMRADLTDETELARVESELRGSVDVLINNAGFGAYMPFVDLPVERADELLRVKVIAPTRLARAALPSMLSRQSGVVVNVASMLGFSAALQMPVPRVTYAAANAYLIAFSQLLHGEAGTRGVRIQALCPPTVRTEFHSIQNRDVSAIPNVLDAGDVVEASLVALELGELICMPSVGDATLVGAWEAAATRCVAGIQPVVADRYAAAGT